MRGRKTVDPLSVRIAVYEQVPPREPIYRGGRPPLVWDASNVSKSRWRDALKIGAVSERVGAKRRLLPGGVDRQML